MIRATLLAFLFIGLFPASAQEPAEPAESCGTISELSDSLEWTYAESPRAIGITGDGDVISLWIDENSGTFTVILSKPGAESCVKFAGHDWIWDKSVLILKDGIEH